MKDWKKAGLAEVARPNSNVTKAAVIDAIDAEIVEQVTEKKRIKIKGGLLQECREIVHTIMNSFLTAVKGMK